MLPFKVPSEFLKNIHDEENIDTIFRNTKYYKKSDKEFEFYIPSIEVFNELGKLQLDPISRLSGFLFVNTTILRESAESPKF